MKIYCGNSSPELKFSQICILAKNEDAINVVYLLINHRSDLVMNGL